jgi:hypothetical protein
MEVVKLRRLAQDVGHQVIGGLKFLQTERSGFISQGLGVDFVACGRNQIQSGLHLFGTDGVDAGLGGGDPGGAGQKIEQAWIAIAGAGQQVQGGRAQAGTFQGEHQGNDTGLDHQPCAAPIRLNPCIQGFEVGVNCAAATAIMALAGKTSAQGASCRCRSAGILPF